MTGDYGLGIILGWMMVVIIACVVFVPLIGVSVGSGIALASNIREGRKLEWKLKRNIVGVSISSVILVVSTIALVMALVYILPQMI